jgi:hypothetical protein
VVRREFQLAKKASWTKYCSSITLDTGIKLSDYKHLSKEKHKHPMGDFLPYVGD